MYDNAKSCVRKNSDFSAVFDCQIGVRQGENLSPLLFAIFINDFHYHNMSRHYSGIPFVPIDMANCINNDELFVLRLWLLYVDDTIILAKTACDLQKALDALSDYCKQWKMTVNASKTKIIIFSRGKIRNKPLFKIGIESIAVVDEYIYLGTTLNCCNGSFKKAITNQISQAKGAMFSLIAKAQRLNLPIDIIVELYDQL